jgi:hypothetical protein
MSELKSKSLKNVQLNTLEKAKAKLTKAGKASPELNERINKLKAEIK